MNGTELLELDIIGHQVHSVNLDYAVSLLTDGGVELRIESAFSVCTPSDQVAEIDPERLGSSLGGLVFILHHTVVGAVVHEDATLVLDFENSARVEVGANQAYEAWTLVGSHGLRVVMGPGGVLSTWAADT